MPLLFSPSWNIDFKALNLGKPLKFSCILSIAKSVGRNERNEQNEGTHKMESDGLMFTYSFFFF